MRSQRVLACCLGPVTAAPLEAEGIPTVQPERARLGSIMCELAESLPRRDARPMRVAGHRLVVLGTGARLDGEFVEVRPTQLALLRALAERPGHVLTRAELAVALPGRRDEHAVEMAVARLRSCLGQPSLDQTVVKRGYRLATTRTGRTDRPGRPGSRRNEAPNGTAGVPHRSRSCADPPRAYRWGGHADAWRRGGCSGMTTDKGFHPGSTAAAATDHDDDPATARTTAPDR